MGEARSLVPNKPLICQVCEKNEAEGVACVPGVPYSAAYCQECLEANAHPWFIIVANTVCVGSYEDCVPWWKQMVEDTCKHLGKTMEEFETEVLKGIKDMAKSLRNVDDEEGGTT